MYSSVEKQCLVCDLYFPVRGFYRHINREHKMNSRQYILIVENNNIHPICKCGCEQETSFINKEKFAFYVKGHGNKGRKITGDKLKKRNEKREKTCLIKYGVSHPMKNENIKQHLKSVFVGMYGVDNPNKVPAIKQKGTEKMMEHIENAVEKRRETCKLKYGTDSHMQTEYFKNTFREMFQMDWEKVLDYAKEKNYIVLSFPDEYTNARGTLRFKCKTHGTEFVSQIFYVSMKDVHQCPDCKTLRKSEKKLFSVLRNIFGETKVMYGFKGFEWLKTAKGRMEIDFYIPDLKLAIERDGEQHYRQVNFSKQIKERHTLEYRQKLDALKNKLILEHLEEIKTFIRIPYWDPITEKNVKYILVKNGVVLP